MKERELGDGGSQEAASEEERLWSIRLWEAEKAFEQEYLQRWEELVDEIAGELYLQDQDIAAWKEAGRIYARRFAQEGTLLAWEKSKKTAGGGGDNGA